MPLLQRPRRTPWLAGLLLLALALAAVAPAGYAFGWRRWPLHAGLLAAVVLLFGWIERRWQGRPLPRRYRALDRSRFRVFPGGKGKGNGQARDLPDDAPEGDGDKPRWVM
ncbi:MAG TPA: hypothetical protein VMX54_05090 [Vicinamibacteria bacterium]|nr:hypothetical protein [Vicinamibacteria bacterium]